MINIRVFLGVFAAIVAAGVAASPSFGEDATTPSPFQAYVDMKTFMQHVLTPAATIIWRANGLVDKRANTTCPPNRRPTGKES